MARIDRDGRLTFQTYDTTASKTEAGVKVGLGVGVGVEGSQSNESRDISGSWVREPGGTWKPAQLRASGGTWRPPGATCGARTIEAGCRSLSRSSATW